MYQYSAQQIGQWIAMAPDGVARTTNGENIFHRAESLIELVGNFAGAASMCWENPEGAGEFQSQEAGFFADQFIERMDDFVKIALLKNLPYVMAAELRMSKEFVRAIRDELFNG